MRMINLFKYFFNILILLFNIIVPAQIQYDVIDLGTLGGLNSTAHGINNLGQIIGSAQDINNRGKAFLWQNGVMSDLGTLGGNHSTAFGINDSGFVVGDANNFEGRTRATLWQNGTAIDLGMGNSSSAYDINDLGQIVGNAQDNDFTRAFIWQNGGFEFLGTFGGSYSHAVSLNNLGQVAGWALDINENGIAFLWENNVMINLGTLGGTSSEAYCINNSGKIVGLSYDLSNTVKAVAWQDGLIKQISDLNHSSARAINDLGQVVGRVFIIDVQQNRAFIWQNGVGTNLNDLVDPDSGWVLREALDINDLGQIVGWGNRNGSTTNRAFLLTPKQVLNITKPTSDDKFIAAEKDTIRWTGGQPGQFFEIFYSDDNGTNYNLIEFSVPADSGYYIWDIPPHILTTKGKIQIEDQTNSEISAVSETFRIKPLVLTRLTADSNYYEFRKDRDQWNFSNTVNDIWPQTWWQQFNYQGIDPFTGTQYSQIAAKGTFKNSNSNTHMDWVSWVNTFSVDACYWSANSIFPAYKNNAVFRWRGASKTWEGSCFGIAIANALAFGHREQFMIKHPNFPSFNNPIDVVSNNDVKKIINEIFTYQLGNPHNSYREQIAKKKTPKETLIELIEYFTEDNPQVRTLGFNNNVPKGGGHEIFAYGLEKDPLNPDVFFIKVYDNSYPGSTNKIKIDTSADGGIGSWSSPDWSGWGGKKWIYLTNPAVEYLTNPILPKIDSDQSLFVISQELLEVTGPITSSIRIQDTQGKITGFYNNSIHTEIFNSYPLILQNGAETPPYGYTVPIDNYSIILDGFTEDTLEVFLFTGNRILLYEREGATQNQTDRLFFDGGVSVTNPDTDTKNISLVNLISETTHEKLFAASSISMIQNDSVKVENPDSNTIKLISYGSAKNYDIELNYVNANEIGRFVEFGIPLQANSSHIFSPEWTDLTSSQLIVLVDIGNNGIIDDTLRLDNKVTGIENNNNPFLPEKYYLEQNYPNPFNPSTMISWQSPVGNHQVLKVYDLLGNEVATLVDEYREAGRHSVMFDASQLASGVYIYRLTAGAFIETKKMLLLK